MFELCLPFPGYERISKEFPQHCIDNKTYCIAKEFYMNSLKNAADEIRRIIRQNEPEQERAYVDSLVSQAIAVASAYSMAS